MFDFTDSDGDSGSDIDQEQITTPVLNKPVVIPGKRHLDELKELLDLESFQKKKLKKAEKRKRAKARKKGSACSGAIETLASKEANCDSAEIVKFVDHKKRKKDQSGVEASVQPLVTRNTDGKKEISMKQARFDVFKFGVSGLDKKSREEANTALAVRLGAKPAKNKSVEYKQLKEERALEKEELELRKLEQEESVKGVRKASKKDGNKSTNKTKAKKSNSKSSGDFRVGSFDGGMLKLSSKDIAKVKS